MSHDQVSDEIVKVSDEYYAWENLEGEEFYKVFVKRLCAAAVSILFVAVGFGLGKIMTVPFVKDFVSEMVGIFPPGKLQDWVAATMNEILLGKFPDDVGGYVASLFNWVSGKGEGLVDFVVSRVWDFISVTVIPFIGRFLRLIVADFVGKLAGGALETVLSPFYTWVGSLRSWLWR